MKILTNPSLNWSVFAILVMVMLANVVVGTLHSKLTGEFKKNYFIEHLVKKILFTAVLFITIVLSHNAEIHEFGTVVISVYAVVEGYSFKKHFLEFKEGK